MEKIKFNDLPFIIKFATIWIFYKFIWWCIVIVAHLILIGYHKEIPLVLLGAFLK